MQAQKNIDKQKFLGKAGLIFFITLMNMFIPLSTDLYLPALPTDVYKRQLHVPANCYRAEKLPLYYAGETIELGKGVVLGGLIETKATKMKVKAEETGALLPAEFKAKVVEEDDRMLLNGFFEENTIAQVLLVNEAGDITRYEINTVPQHFQAM